MVSILRTLALGRLKQRLRSPRGPQLHSKFKASLGHMRLYNKKAGPGDGMPFLQAQLFHLLQGREHFVSIRC